MTAIAETLAHETFATGFSTDPGGRWFHLRMGHYTTDDGVVTTRGSGGVHVAARGVNRATGEPAFSITQPQEAAGGGIPATNDHAKWLVYMNHLSSAGVPGFDTSADLQLAGTARIGGRTFGTDRHPFGNAVADPQTDLRLGAFAMTTIDLESFVVFDFLFTNRRVYAFYERLPFGRTAANQYAAFSYRFLSPSGATATSTMPRSHTTAAPGSRDGCSTAPRCTAWPMSVACSRAASTW